MDEPPHVPGTPTPDAPPPPGEVRRYEANQPGPARERSGPGAVVFGIVAALGLATVAVLAGGVAMLVGMVVATDGDVTGGLIGVAIAAVLAGAAAAGWYIARSLPRGSRGPFWAMFVLCGASALIMLFGVCGAGTEFMR